MSKRGHWSTPGLEAYAQRLRCVSSHYGVQSPSHILVNSRSVWIFWATRSAGRGGEEAYFSSRYDLPNLPTDFHSRKFVILYIPEHERFAG